MAKVNIIDTTLGNVTTPLPGDGVERIDAEAVNSKENRSLYEARKKIHPQRATGTFRKFKWIVMIITLGIYYLTPWIRWERGHGLPDQAVLLDLANRRFYFFMIEIWPHEFFYVAGMLVMAGIGLFLVTSVLGRAWCGYTCPQTVWVDLFLVVERFFEGDRNARIKLDASPWSSSKLYKRVAKHTVWIVISVLTGGAWIFYFADAPTLLSDFVAGNSAYVAYATVGILTATTYVFGGLLREQVCTYMCPWPRIQAAMLDEKSLTVTYNDWRGEPRSRHAKKMRKDGVPTGDCVDCNACVAVCPMGIDIRDGQQMECITCALCIDACDNVMSKLGLEKGLIAYATLEDYEANMALAGAGKHISEPVITPENVRDKAGKLSEKVSSFSPKVFLRTRTLIYLGIYAAIGIFMITHLTMRDRLDVKVLHDRNPQFVVLSDGSIRNGYEVKILNMKGEAQQFLITVGGLRGPLISEAGSKGIPRNWLATEVQPDQTRAIKVFLTMRPDRIFQSSTPFTFTVSQMGSTDQKTVKTIFNSALEN
ncbi:MAG: cytochrome c oxidase accessory protein CcoG [Rhizobiaceae bacterium]|nr:cytochrome c oxidase accessory protein CcoG [Rhizobiaceae bacterium]